MKGALYWEELFGFNHQAIESKVEDRDGSYKNLSPEALYTSFDDLEVIFKNLPLKGTWVDLGAGVGQSALMYGHLFPDQKAIAVEFDPSRVQSGQEVLERLGFNNVKLLHQDLLEDEIPEGDIYFLYFPTGKVLDRIISELSKRKRNFYLVAIESHGNLLARIQKENWLKTVSEIKLKSARHYPYAVVFKAQAGDRGEETILHDLSFQEKILSIEENGHIWLGESMGLEWQKKDSYDLLIPPRTICQKQVVQIDELSKLKEELRFLIRLRRLGAVKIQSHRGIFEGEIRKIYSKPSFVIEISSGEKVEWEDVQSISWGHNLCYDASSHLFYLPHVLTK